MPRGKHVSDLSASAAKPGEEEQPGLESPKRLGLQQDLATPLHSVSFSKSCASPCSRFLV